MRGSRVGWLIMSGACAWGACGRSELFANTQSPPEESAGTGGAGTGGESTTDGSATDASQDSETESDDDGSVVTDTNPNCPPFVARAERGFDFPKARVEIHPTLVTSSDDGQLVALTVHETQTGLIIPFPKVPLKPVHSPWLRAVELPLWDAWVDAPIGQTFLATGNIANASFAVADAPGAGITILYAALQPKSGGMALNEIEYEDDLTSVVELEQPGRRALAISASSTDRLLVFEREESNPVRRRMELGRYASGISTYHSTSGCASTPLYADALRLNSTYVIAFSTRGAFGACSNLAQSSGAADRVELAVWQDGAGPELVSTLDAGAAVTSLRLLRTSSALWLVWQGSGPGSVHAARVDLVDLTIDEPIQVLDAASAAFGFAASAFGGGFAIAHPRVEDAQHGAIRVRVFDSGAHELAPTDYFPEAHYQWTEPIALLGSSDGTALLLAWTMSPQGGDTRTRLTRLECPP